MPASGQRPASSVSNGGGVRKGIGVHGGGGTGRAGPLGAVGVAARGPYQLEADLPVLPVHLGVVVLQARGRAAGSAGCQRQRRVPQALQGMQQGLLEIATAAGMGHEGAGGVVFVQVEERLLRDAVQLLQLPFNLGVPGIDNGERAGLRGRPCSNAWPLWTSVSLPETDGGGGG